MPAHHSQARKLHRAAAQRKTRLCRFFFSDEGCANGSACAFAHGADEIQASMLGKDTAGNCSRSDDSTSVCSEETASLWSAETSSLGEATGPSSRYYWADANDNEEDDEWPSMWAPYPQHEMLELSIASARFQAPPAALVVRSAAAGKAASKAERRELVVAAARAKRAELTSTVLDGLLRQARGPHLYED